MILFWFGDDTYSIVEQRKKLQQDFAQKHGASGIEYFELSSDTPDESLLIRLRELFGNLGLFADHKLIIFGNIVGKLGDFPKSQAWLSGALKKLSSEFTAAFVQTQAVDRRLKFFKTLKDLARAKEFSVPTGKELEAWIKKYLSGEGFRIEPEALQTLIARLGEAEDGTPYDLWQVANELQKLMLLHWQDRLITAASIAAVVPQTLPQNIFYLINLVSQGNVKEAIRILEKMINIQNPTDSKTQILQIVGALASQIRNLILIKDFEGQDPGTVAKILNWKEGRVWVNLKIAKKYTSERLTKLLHDLKALDMRLKTSEEPPKLLLTLFFRKAKA